MNRWPRRTSSVALALLTGLSFLSLPAQASKKESDLADIGNRKVAHRSLISEQKEIQVGRQYAAEIDRKARLITDPVVTEYINRIAQNLARNSDLQVPINVKVIDDPSINAFALPGGFLYVNTGLIEAADEEDELAGVMAHEIGHVAARHWASQMTRATLMQYATIPLIFVPMSYPVYLGISNALNLGVPLTFLKFSRNAESEADYLGLEYMYKAGYDPNSYVAFFGKVTEEERHDPENVPKLFLDHPPTPDRVVKCEEEIKNVLPPRPQYLVSTSEFNDVKTRLQTIVNSRKPGEGTAPTLHRREQNSRDKTGSDQGKDQPPILRRHD